MVCLREIGRGEGVQGCCYASSVHTTASNLSLGNEERDDGAHRVSAYGMWNEGESSEVSAPDHQDSWAGEKNVWTNSWADRKDGKVKLSSLTGAEGSCWPYLYSSCLLWKVHRVWHFIANVKHQRFWLTTGIYLGTACGLCGNAEILQFTALSCDSWWERPLKGDLQKIQENCPNYPLRLGRAAKLWLCLCNRYSLSFSQN